MSHTTLKDTKNRLIRKHYCSASPNAGVFSQEAKDEFVEAERYYEQQLPGLGRSFREEIRLALWRVRSWPLLCPIERGEIRRLILTRFPYKLLYSIEIYLVAGEMS